MLAVAWGWGVAGLEYAAVPLIFHPMWLIAPREYPPPNIGQDQHSLTMFYFKNMLHSIRGPGGYR
jgi:hypothetical protein